MFDFLRRSMIARLLAVGAIAMVTSGSQVSCSSGDTSRLDDEDDLEESTGPTFTTRLVLRDAAGVERYSYSRGESITFELTVRNRTPQPQTVSLASTQVFDMFVFTPVGNTPLWRSSEGLSFAQVITPLSFAAEETKTLRHTWDMAVAGSGVIAPGNYEARGQLMAVGVPLDPEAAHQLASTLRAFTVN